MLGAAEFAFPRRLIIVGKGGGVLVVTGVLDELAERGWAEGRGRTAAVEEQVRGGCDDVAFAFADGRVRIRVSLGSSRETSRCTYR